MGTTYQPPWLAGYDDRRHGTTYPASYSTNLLSDADRKRSILSELTNSATLGSGRSNSIGSGASFRPDSAYTTGLNDPYSSAAPPMVQPAPAPLQGYFAQQPAQKQANAHEGGSAVSAQQSRPSTPPAAQGTGRSPITISEQDSACMVMHSLEVPKCIDPKGGSLPTFTAELTCLFWFESPMVYQLADNIDMIPQDVGIPRICPNAIPNPNFKSWVSRMLTTTQVTQNVVFLALLFIYRLKSLNPMVRGKPGSEFRLLTVALMLGNKFLDDNTYTNKTWSDVSALNVKDIHVMEVEFLSNMRYSLLVSAAEWKEWLVKLAKFRLYYERASAPSPLPPQAASSPQRPLASPAASPITVQPSAHSFKSSMSSSYDSAKSPTARSAYTGNSAAVAPQHAWPTSVPYNLSPLAMKPDMNAYGKRTHGHDDPTEPPPKRLIRPVQPAAAASMVLGHQTADPFTSLPMTETMRLPVPHLTLNTTTNQAPIAAPGMAPGPYSATAIPVPHAGQSNLSLPPLTHGMRAMASVYPSSASGLPAGPVVGGGSFPPKLPMLTTTGPSVAQPPMVAHAATGGTTPTAFAAPSFGTPTKRMSPLNVMTPSVASAYAAGPTSSPLTESFPHMSTVHTPISHSPSIYLQQRPSPYRPIRNVHMLLNPPPSTSLQDYQTTGDLLISPAQMYYQPLGRRNDLRTGIVPEFQGGMPYGAGMRPGVPMAPAQGMQQPTAMPYLQPMQMPVPMPMRDGRGMPMVQHLPAQQLVQQQLAQQQQQQQQQAYAVHPPSQYDHGAY